MNGESKLMVEKNLCRVSCVISLKSKVKWFVELCYPGVFVNDLHLSCPQKMGEVIFDMSFVHHLFLLLLSSLSVSKLNSGHDKIYP